MTGCLERKEIDFFLSRILYLCQTGCRGVVFRQPFHFTHVHFDTSAMVKHAFGLSYMDGEITVPRETSHFLRGTIYKWQSGETLRRSDSFRNGDVSFWPRLFMPVFYDWVLWFERGNSEAWDGFNTDVLLMFSERHFDTASVGLVLLHQRRVSQNERGSTPSRINRAWWILPDGL